MILVGITGAIGHGKTTLAQALLKVDPDATHFETGMIVAEIADRLHQKLNVVPSSANLSSINNWLSHLPSIIKGVTHKTCSFSDIKLTNADIAKDPGLYGKLFAHLDSLKHHPELARHNITTDNKSSYRAFLQWLGGYLVKKVDAGIWYDELINRLKTSGAHLGVISGVRFPSDAEIVHKAHGVIINIVRPGTSEADAKDLTERDRNAIITDCTVINNAGIEEIVFCANKIIADIRSQSLQKRYVASEFI